MTAVADGGPQAALAACLADLADNQPADASCTGCVRLNPRQSATR